MINIVLDTNTWLYLCNGYDQETSKHQSGLNFKLLNDLISLVDSGKIRLFVNEVIFTEFKRNTDVAQKHIKDLERSLTGRTEVLKSVKKELTSEGRAKVDEILTELEGNVKAEIDVNQKHIARVEDLLFNKSEIIPIENKLYKEVSDLAIAKKAPFHKKNNSHGDALILLSAADFFKANSYEDSSSTIFVSNNSDDYCESKGSNKVHADLEPYFRASDISFELNVAKALNLSKELIAQIDEYNKYLDSISYCVANCNGEEFGTNLVIFDAPIEIKIDGTEDKHFNPDQLQLDLAEEFKITEEDVLEANSKNLVSLELGFCTHCSAAHVKCECGAVNYSYDEVGFECDCGLIIYQGEDGDYRVAKTWPDEV